MIGPIIVSMFAAALIATYMLIVNHFMRQDEHYYSQDDTPEETRTECRAGAAMTHAHA
jgi:hypothetical protein